MCARSILCCASKAVMCEVLLGPAQCLEKLPTQQNMAYQGTKESMTFICPAIEFMALHETIKPIYLLISIRKESTEYLKIIHIDFQNIAIKDTILVIFNITGKYK